MLSIGAMGNGQGTYYVGLTSESYYLEGGEPAGKWIGTGVETLDLPSTVVRERFLGLFTGVGVNGKMLVQNAGDPKRQPGWDLTFSTPKSVSLAWALSDPAMREAIAEAQFAAVKEAIAFVEEGAITRRGKGGGSKQSASLVVATFEHGTSRAQDPQLHTHALVLNLGIRQDGTTGSLESRSFYRSKMAAGALYRADLSHRLTQLGFSIRRAGTSFEIEGVPSSLLKETSKRRHEIEAALEKRGKSGGRAAAVAALATRSNKEHIARETLFSLWREVAAAHGLDLQAVQALSSRAQKSQPAAPSQMKEAVQGALERLSSEQSHFSKHDLLRALSEEAQGRGISGALIRDQVVQELEANAELVFLGESVGEKRYTTRELLDVEKKLLSTVEGMRTGKAFHISDRVVEKAISEVEAQATKNARAKDTKAQAVAMNEEQKRALRHITQGDGSISLVAGMAGTGKTFLLQAAREAWEKSGLQVIGAAVAGKAARGLEEGAGIKSTTLAQLLYEPDAWSGKALKHHATQLLRAAQGRETYKLSGVTLEREMVVVLDESGMTGTRDMARLVDKVSRAGAKLVLVGDSRQLQPIDVGGPFRAMERLLGAARLETIVRQELDQNDKNPNWRREAVKAFADGEAGKALHAYKERGFLTVTADRDQAKTKLVEAWAPLGKIKPEENLIFASTRQETRDLNRMAQESRERAGKLGLRSIRLGGERIREKDRVLITRNDRLLGISNGDLGTVKRLELITGKMILRLDNGLEVALPYRHFKHIELGYAVTTHKGQGVTVKNSYVLCGGAMTDREMSYVQASRARKDTRFYTEEIKVWNPDLAKREDRTMEELSRQMSQSRAKDLAHSVLTAEQIPQPDLRPERVQELLPSR